MLKKSRSESFIRRLWPGSAQGAEGTKIQGGDPGVSLKDREQTRQKVCCSPGREVQARQGSNLLDDVCCQKSLGHNISIGSAPNTSGKTRRPASIGLESDSVGEFGTVRPSITFLKAGQRPFAVQSDHF